MKSAGVWALAHMSLVLTRNRWDMWAKAHTPRKSIVLSHEIATVFDPRPETLAVDSGNQTQTRSPNDGLRP